ncbi:PpiC-type peptidyl-prolyl cis-trans isomerase [Rhodopirellula sallentina SM41]|uniref:Periplasmic chaperone PpiD n=1 Tax=Rhodopirellula sallentina SM41 TaxID=1263870 RepID=M5TZG0_9BACT|nr:PpiC-type peptidyl-prolyl cis-trans isomerase [Rhodopirellula sallentina SM41]
MGPHELEASRLCIRSRCRNESDTNGFNSENSRRRAGTIPSHSRTLSALGRDGKSVLAVFALTLAFASNAIAQMPTQAQMDEALQIELPTDPATLIAMVGQSPILLGELNPKIDARIKDVLEKAGQEVPEDQIKFARVRMLRGLLAQTIQNRMMRESFLLDQVATQTAEKRREADAEMQAKARQMFFESEVPELRKQYEATTVSELDEKLRNKGTSLAAREREFIDAMLGHLYIRGKVNRDPSVSLAEIHEYYTTHHDEFYRKSRARWEQITVKFANHPSKKAAYDAIWAMGREAFFGGNMQAIARAKSEEPFASDGGVHDWTNQGALASTILDKQVFSIPIMAMSQIIEDVDAYHIIRVTEREPEGLVPLADVQDDIRTILRDQKIEVAQKEALEAVQKRVPVWSIFPEDVPGAKPLPQVAARFPNRQ